MENNQKYELTLILDEFYNSSRDNYTFSLSKAIDDVVRVVNEYSLKALEEVLSDIDDASANREAEFAKELEDCATRRRKFISEILDDVKECMGIGFHDELVKMIEYYGASIEGVVPYKIGKYTRQKGYKHIKGYWVSEEDKGEDDGIFTGNFYLKTDAKNQYLKLRYVVSLTEDTAD